MNYTTRMLMAHQTADMIVTALLNHDEVVTLRLWLSVPVELNLVVLKCIVEIMDTTGIKLTPTGYQA
jgi:hypothetical protein